MSKAHELNKLWSAALFFHQPKIRPGRQTGCGISMSSRRCQAKDEDFILWTMRNQRRFLGRKETTRCDEDSNLGRSAPGVRGVQDSLREGA